MNIHPKSISTAAWGLIFVLLLESVSAAQIASALIREGDTLPDDPSGRPIDDISYCAQNGIGGYAFMVTQGTSNPRTNRYWGNFTGGMGAILRSESTIGTNTQVIFNSFGISDNGTLAYKAQSIGGVENPYISGIWIDSSVILNEEEPIPSLPGLFSKSNNFAGITRDGKLFWYGSYSTNPGGNSTGSALFFGNDASVLLKSGDSVVGVAEPISEKSGTIIFPRFSADGTRYITLVEVDSASTANDQVIVSNGNAMIAGGSPIREGSPIPLSIGGLPGELYENFGSVFIAESGSYLIRGDSNAASTLEKFLIIDGQIRFRDGDTIDNVTLNGGSNTGSLNENGDWAVFWDVDTPTGETLEALIFNGDVVLIEGDLIDWNNDAVIDAADQNAFITHFTGGTSSMSLSDRDANGNARLLFDADVNVNGSIRIGGFSMTYHVSAEPVGVLGDANGDGNFDFSDIEAFFLAVTDLPAYTAMYPDVAIVQLDLNDDGNTDFADIEAFFIAVTGG